MAFISLAKRYAASSEQQKLLQRNISGQAESARLATDREDLRKRQATLDRLSAITVVTDEAAMSNLITGFTAMVDRAMVPVLPDDIVAWDV
jgi:uncharacterized protein YlxW (UPF0749 family)